MEEPGFWDDPERSTRIMKEAKNLKDTVESYRRLETQFEEIGLLIEMGYEENDPEVIPEIQEMMTEFEEKLENLRISTLLSGEYDSSNAILKLNAGAGGTESCDWCSMLYRMYCRFADKMGFTTEVLDYTVPAAPADSISTRRPRPSVSPTFPREWWYSARMSAPSSRTRTRPCRC